MAFLEHAADAIRSVLGDRGRILFIPFASGDPGAYAELMRKTLAGLGVQVDSLHEVADPARAVRQAEAYFTGGGNSFRLLRALNRLDVLDAIGRAVRHGVPYLGASAGSNVACPSIRTTNDMPITEVPSLSALGLIPFQLNPHYLDPEPGSTHQGENRQRRIEEFLEENDVPVLGLREGTWLRVSGPRAVLGGVSTGRLFLRAVPPADVPAGTDLSFLLGVTPRFDVGPGRAAGLARLARRAVAGLLLAGLPCLALEPAPVALPPRTIARRHVVVARAQADRAVDELADDVGLPGVPVGLGDHVDQDLVQRHLAAVLRPPWHVAGGVQPERADGGVGMRPSPLVQARDLFA
jgi:dipeptidase E